jgi:hypothetical protein
MCACGKSALQSTPLASKKGKVHWTTLCEQRNEKFVHLLHLGQIARAKLFLFRPRVAPLAPGFSES